jgi:gamma-glutamyltranspeptidase / glutathione hydrolase
VSRSLLAIFFFAMICQAVPAEEPHAAKPSADTGSPSYQSMIATVHPLATDAGLNALKGGGNAVDAMVAAALTLGVVDGHNSGIGGGCFILIRSPDGKLTAIDGRETAGSRASRDMFMNEEKGDTTRSQTGPLAVAVPGAISAMNMALSMHGTKQLGDLILPAAKIAEEGFAIDPVLGRNLREHATALNAFSGSRAALLKPDGSPYQSGEILKQPDLARTYRMIAEHGADWFYRGEFAKRVATWMNENGGILTTEDFAGYRAVLREPLLSTYRGYTIVGFPPPSSGGVHVAQILGILEHFEIAEIYGQNQEQGLHIILEAMKLAFADRAYWLGDADFAAVPKGLVDPTYLKSLAGHIHLQAASHVAGHGTPPGFRENTFSRGHTTHISAVDASGYWVAMTATVNTGFGSKVIVPGTGVVLNNEMDDFAIQPGVPNAFGLVGAENNSVAPGKRPLSSMTPTLVLKDHEPMMALGGAGGPKIISQVVLAIIRYLDFKMSLEDAVGLPRVHHQWQPDRVLVESGIGSDIIMALKAKGHEVQSVDQMGVCQAIVRLPSGTLHGVHDPRIPGKAAGN